MDQPRAIIYVPLSGHAAERWRRACADHCIRSGYRVVLVAPTSQGVGLYLRQELADLVVTPRQRDRRSLLRALQPRIEVLPEIPRQRRGCPSG